MIRKQISQMTEQQCLNELTYDNLRKLLKKARAAQVRADEALRRVFLVLEDMCLDLDAPTDAENADNLDDAVSCYIQYGEYSIAGLIKEIKAQYERED